jgi:hypothetical protein
MIGDWGLGIGDWGLGPIPNPQSPIPNPQYNILKITKSLITNNKKYCSFLLNYKNSTLESSYKTPEITEYPVYKNIEFVSLSNLEQNRFNTSGYSVKERDHNKSGSNISSLFNFNFKVDKENTSIKDKSSFNHNRLTSLYSQSNKSFFNKSIGNNHKKSISFFDLNKSEKANTNLINFPIYFFQSYLNIDDITNSNQKKINNLNVKSNYIIQSTTNKYYSQNKCEINVITEKVESEAINENSNKIIFDENSGDEFTYENEDKFKNDNLDYNNDYVNNKEIKLKCNENIDIIDDLNIGELSNKDVKNNLTESYNQYLNWDFQNFLEEKFDFILNNSVNNFDFIKSKIIDGIYIKDRFELSIKSVEMIVHNDNKEKVFSVYLPFQFLYAFYYLNEVEIFSLLSQIITFSNNDKELNDSQQSYNMDESFSKRSRLATEEENEIPKFNKFNEKEEISNLGIQWKYFMMSLNLIFKRKGKRDNEEKGVKNNSIKKFTHQQTTTVKKIVLFKESVEKEDQNLKNQEEEVIKNDNDNYNNMSIDFFINNQRFLITLDYPKIEFSINDKNKTIRKYISKKLLLYLMKENFINWEFYIFNYLGELKLFRLIFKNITSNNFFKMSNEKILSVYFNEKDTSIKKKKLHSYRNMTSLPFLFRRAELYNKKGKKGYAELKTKIEASENDNDIIYDNRYVVSLDEIRFKYVSLNDFEYKFIIKGKDGIIFQKICPANFKIEKLDKNTNKISNKEYNFNLKNLKKIEELRMYYPLENYFKKFITFNFYKIEKTSKVKSLGEKVYTKNFDKNSKSIKDINKSNEINIKRTKSNKSLYSVKSKKSEKSNLSIKNKNRSEAILNNLTLKNKDEEKNYFLSPNFNGTNYNKFENEKIFHNETKNEDIEYKNLKNNNDQSNNCEKDNSKMRRASINNVFKPGQKISFRKSFFINKQDIDSTNKMKINNKVDIKGFKTENLFNNNKKVENKLVKEISNKELSKNKIMSEIGSSKNENGNENENENNLIKNSNGEKLDNQTQNNLSSIDNNKLNNLDKNDEFLVHLDKKIKNEGYNKLASNFKLHFLNKYMKNDHEPIKLEVNFDFEKFEKININLLEYLPVVFTKTSVLNKEGIKSTFFNYKTEELSIDNLSKIPIIIERKSNFTQDEINQIEKIKQNFEYKITDLKTSSLFRMCLTNKGEYKKEIDGRIDDIILKDFLETDINQWYVIILKYIAFFKREIKETKNKLKNARISLNECGVEVIDKHKLVMQKKVSKLIDLGIISSKNDEKIEFLMNRYKNADSKNSDKRFSQFHLPTKSNILNTTNSNDSDSFLKRNSLFPSSIKSQNTNFNLNFQNFKKNTIQNSDEIDIKLKQLTNKNLISKNRIS